jgi:hypothetical protein
MFTVASATFDELEHAYAEATTDSPECKPKRGCSFAFAVTGVNLNAAPFQSHASLPFKMRRNYINSTVYGQEKL